VDLVLRQGMLSAGWHAHTLNAPGKFLVSAPEHTTPTCARAYLVTDDDVARVTARYGSRRLQLDGVSRAALDAGPAVTEPVPWYLRNAAHVSNEPEDSPDSRPIWWAIRRAEDRGFEPRMGSLPNRISSAAP
jgi:hypothetical protein